jgi:hypothetical protein
MPKMALKELKNNVSPEGENYLFLGGGINIVSKPKYRPLSLSKENSHRRKGRNNLELFFSLQII